MTRLKKPTLINPSLQSARTFSNGSFPILHRVSGMTASNCCRIWEGGAFHFDTVEEPIGTGLIPVRIRHGGILCQRPRERHSPAWHQAR